MAHAPRNLKSIATGSSAAAAPPSDELGMPVVDDDDWATAAFAEFAEFEAPIAEDLVPPAEFAGDRSDTAWLSERLTYLATLESHCLIARDAHASLVRTVRGPDGAESGGLRAFERKWRTLVATSAGAAAAVLARAAMCTYEASAQVFGADVLSGDQPVAVATIDDAAASPPRRRRWPAFDRHVPELSPTHLAGDAMALQHNLLAALRTATAAPAVFEVDGAEEREGGDGAAAAPIDAENDEYEAALSKRHMAEHRRFCRLDANFLRGELAAAAEHGAVRRSVCARAVDRGRARAAAHPPLLSTLPTRRCVRSRPSPWAVSRCRTLRKMPPQRRPPRQQRARRTSVR